MSELADLSLEAASDLVRLGKVSPRELTRASLERIESLDPLLHAFITVLPERAMDQARLAEEEIGRGDWRGRLHGIPIGLKDLIDTSFAPTTAGMPLRADHIPERNATVVQRLEAAGAVIVGKLAMTEGAFAAHHPELPVPINPWSDTHWTGISSSGSGVAAATGMCFAALGSDTGGSIRLPSAACGLTGLKPTWGRVSRAGVFPLGETLDHVGPMARSAIDAAIVLEAIAGRDDADPTALTDAVPAYAAGLTDGLNGVRIGVDESIGDDRVASEVRDAVAAAVQVLESQGARRQAVTLPPADSVIEAFFPLVASEASLVHRELHDTHLERYGDTLSELVTQGAAMTGPAIAQAHIARRRWTGELATMFRDVDLVVVPAIPVPVPTLEALPTVMANPHRRLAQFTIPFNMSGTPTITLPGGFDDNGLPIGIQIVGPHLSEHLLLRAAAAFQATTDWHERRPPLATAPGGLHPQSP